jgi:hypothetical protein
LSEIFGSHEVNSLIDSSPDGGGLLVVVASKGFVEHQRQPTDPKVLSRYFSWSSLSTVIQGLLKPIAGT